MDNKTEFFVDVPCFWRSTHNVLSNYWFKDHGPIPNWSYIKMEGVIQDKLNCLIVTLDTEVITRIYFKTAEELISFVLRYG